MKFRNFWGLVLMILFLSSSAFAAGINVHCTGTGGSGYAQDKNSANLSTSSAIQWIFAVPGFPNPNKSEFIDNINASLYKKYSIGEGTAGTAGTFDINTTADQTSYLRVWASGGPAQGGYYANLGPYFPGDLLPSENNISTFKTTLLADKPKAPKKPAVSGFNLTYIEGQGYQPSFTISAQKNDAEEAEIFGWQIFIKKKEADWKDAKQYAGQSAAITEDPANPFYNTKDKYQAYAVASNYFGSSPNSDITDFEIPSMEAGGATTTVVATAEPVAFTFNLYPTKPDQIIVNSIAIPGKNLTKPSAAVVNKASDLAKVINDAKGKIVVKAIYQFDPANNAAYGALFDDKGSLTIGDFDLAPGIGYQVYTSDKIENLVFEGK